jgi:hypothetical protein
MMRRRTPAHKLGEPIKIDSGKKQTAVSVGKKISFLEQSEVR